MITEYNPDKDEPVVVSVDLTSDTYAFDVPRSSLNIQITSEGIIADFISATDGTVVQTFCGTFGEIYDAMIERSRQRMESMMSHPASLHFNGGGKPLLMKIFDDIPEYEDWCEANGLDVNDDENYNNYSEWKANS